MWQGSSRWRRFLPLMLFFLLSRNEKKKTKKMIF